MASVNQQVNKVEKVEKVASLSKSSVLLTVKPKILPNKPLLHQTKCKSHTSMTWDEWSDESLKQDDWMKAANHIDFILLNSDER